MKTGTQKSAFGAAPAKAEPTEFITNENPDSSNNSAGSDARLVPPGFSSQSQTVGRGGHCGRADHPSSKQERKGLDELDSQLTQSIDR
jgi:hypothetical protein